MYLLRVDVSCNRLYSEEMNTTGSQEKKTKKHSLSRLFVGLAVASALAVTALTVIFGCFCLKMPSVRVDALKPYITAWAISCAVLIAAIAAVAALIVRKRLLDPVNQISQTAVKYASDKADGRIDDFYFGHLSPGTEDEFEDLARILAGMEKDIAASEQDLMRATSEKQRIRTELKVANDIQENMLPNLFPPFPERKEFDIYATMDPAKEIGGDFYDFFLIDETHLGVVMADVSGKGIPAALFMMSSMIIIGNYARLGYSPGKVLGLSNRAICQLELADMFVTVWFGVLDLESGIVTAANAGHEYPALRKSGGEFELLKQKHSFVIGGMEGVWYKEYRFEMKPGDTLLLYTDGVPEATNRMNELYGTDRMLIALNEAKDLGPRQLLASVREDIDSFVKTAPQFDDLTMLCMTYLGRPNDPAGV